MKKKFRVWSYVENRVIKKFANKKEADAFINKKLRTVGGAYNILSKREVKVFKKTGSQVIQLKE